MYERIIANLVGKKLRREQLHGRAHLVVPMTILAEGVWEGSHGPLFYPEDELKLSAPAWNHKPLVVYHPDNNGEPISACDPNVLDARGIGLQLNTKYKDGLRAEAWIDIEKCKQVDSRIITSLEKGDQVEVSTGVYTTNDDKEGEFNGKKYKAIARKYQPDHLAILPDQIGAFSVKDGGGLLANQSRQPESLQLMQKRMIEEALKPIGVSLTDNELSFSEVGCKLGELLSAKFGKPGKYWGGYVIDTFPDRVVFRDEDNAGLMQIGYTLDKDTVKLQGEAEEVKRVVEYQTNVAATPPIKEPDPMAFNKSQHIASLIGNGWEEADKPTLEAMSDVQLARITPTKKADPPAPVPANNQQKEVSQDEYINNAPPGIREVLRSGVKMIANQKAAMIDAIIKAPGNILSKETLEATPIENVGAIYAVIPKAPVHGVEASMFGPGSAPVANFAGAFGGPVGLPTINESLPVEGLPLPSFDFAEPAKK